MYSSYPATNMSFQIALLLHSMPAFLTVIAVLVFVELGSMLEKPLLGLESLATEFTYNRSLV